MPKTSLTHDRDVTTLTLDSASGSGARGGWPGTEAAQRKPSSRFLRSTARPESTRLRAES